LRGITLRYAHEVRDATEYFADIPKLTLPDEMLSITEHILDTKTGDFDPAYLEDRYRTVLVEKLREKQARAQKPVRSIASTPSRQNVINLMDALKRSLAGTADSAICTTRHSGFETTGRQTVVASVAQGK
jgi:DNA end-binding protein Ku